MEHYGVRNRDGERKMVGDGGAQTPTEVVVRRMSGGVCCCNQFRNHNGGVVAGLPIGS